MWNNDIIVVDLETTGLNPALNEVIEIGAIRLTSDMKLKSPKSWMNAKIIMQHPENASAGALKVNGYTPELWKDAVEPAVAWNQFAKLAAGCVFCAYNVSFDYGFVQQSLLRFGIKDTMSYHKLDILSLSWFYLRNKQHGPYIKLKTVCEDLGIKPEPEIHRAINGALSGARVLRKICAKPEEFVFS